MQGCALMIKRKKQQQQKPHHNDTIALRAQRTSQPTEPTNQSIQLSVYDRQPDENRTTEMLVLQRLFAWYRVEHQRLKNVIWPLGLVDWDRMQTTAQIMCAANLVG